MASIAKQGRKWTVRFRYGGTHYRVTVSEETKADRVRATIEQTLDDVRLGRLTVPDDADIPAFFSSGGRVVASPQTQEGIAFSQAADEYRVNRTAAKTTLDGEAKHLRHLTAYFRSKPLTLLDVQGYVTHRLGHVSAATIRKELTTLRSLLKRYDITLDLKTLRIPPQKPRKRFCSLSNARDGRKVLLGEQDVRGLRDHVRTHGSELIADALDLVAMSGMRRSEVCRIVADDVDLASRSLVIHERKRRHGHVTTRVLPIHPDLVPMLTRRIAEHPTGPLFTGSVDTLGQGLADAIEGSRFDVTGFGWHVLRHSVASRLLAAGTPVTTVAELLGHSTPATTLNIYAHCFQDHLVGAIGLL